MLLEVSAFGPAATLPTLGSDALLLTRQGLKVLVFTAPTPLTTLLISVAVLAGSLDLTGLGATAACSEVGLTQVCCLFVAALATESSASSFRSTSSTASKMRMFNWLWVSQLKGAECSSRQHWHLLLRTRRGISMHVII